MRRQIYVLSRNYDVSLVTVWIRADLKTVIKRNKDRIGTHRVKDVSIKTVFENFESPDQSDIFDRNSITIDSENLINDRYSEEISKIFQYINSIKSKKISAIKATDAPLLKSSPTSYDPDNIYRKLIGEITQNVRRSLLEKQHDDAGDEKESQETLRDKTSRALTGLAQLLGRTKKKCLSMRFDEGAREVFLRTLACNLVAVQQDAPVNGIGPAEIAIVLRFCENGC